MLGIAQFLLALIVVSGIARTIPQPPARKQALLYPAQYVAQNPQHR